MTSRLRILSLVPTGGAGAVLGLVTCNLLLAALPVAFAIETSIMLSLVPAATQAGVGSTAWDSLVDAFLLSAAAFAAQQVLVPVQSLIGSQLARHIDGHVFERLMRASLASPGTEPFDDPRVLDQLGEASRELEFPVFSPGRAAAGMLSLIARYGQLLGFGLVLVVALTWWAGVAVVGTALLFRHGQRNGLRRFSQIYVRMASALRESYYLLRLGLRAGAAKEIRVFGLATWIQERYGSSYLTWMRPVWTQRRRLYVRPFLAYAGVGLVAVSAVLGAIAHAAAGSRLELFQLILAVQACLGAVMLGVFYPEADTQTQLGMNSYDAVEAFEQSVRAFGARPATGAPHDRLSVDAGTDDNSHDIVFRGVSFRYPGSDRPVLDGLDLRIAAGRSVALVGVNGAGKTTLVKLLTRLCVPTSGQILVGDTDIARLRVQAWRRNVAVVFQDFICYPDSAFDNIAFGSVAHRADRAGIRRAAHRAGALAYLDDLPQGLDTLLDARSTGGVDLSGGQWQRVALARALFSVEHGARILILDEPTASLDVRAEARFFEEFLELTRGVTTVLISHRFSTVRHADSIAVLSDGRVVEQGSHVDLMASRGRYFDLFELQASKFVDREPRS